MALPEQFLPAITERQYLELERASEIRHEFLDGLMYAMAGESLTTVLSASTLLRIIGSQVRDKPCRGFSPNMKVRAGIGGLYAYPDLMIVCREEASSTTNHGDVLLNPTVIFEVLSPSTEKYDRGEKFRRYRHRSKPCRMMFWCLRTKCALSIIIVARTAFEPNRD